MTLMRRLITAFTLVLTLAVAARAQELSALARIDPLKSGIVATGDGGLELRP